MRVVHLLLVACLSLALLAGGCPLTGGDSNGNGNANASGGDGADGDGDSNGNGDSNGGDGGNSGDGDSQVNVNAGADQTVVAESLVTLAGSGSVRGSSSGLALAWAQVEGPAVTLSDAAAAGPTFVAPAVVTATSVVFRLTISKADLSNWDEVTITVTPIGPEIPATPTDFGQISAGWKNGTGDVRVVLGWQLPNAQLDGISQGDWGVQGASVGTLRLNEIPSGLHRLTFYLDGGGRAADVSYGVDILGYKYSFSGRISGPLYREVVIEVLGGVARVLFNGWLPASDANAGGPTGTQVAETQVAWRNATDDVNPDVRLSTPLTTLPTSTEAWSLQGFERAVFPAGVPLANGTYWLTFELDGAGRSSDITYFASFPGFSTRVDRRMIGQDRRLIGLDVLSGTARVFFDGWKEGTETGSGGVTGVHPVEVVGAWRNGSADVRVGLDFYVNNTRIPYTEHGFELQGCQRMFQQAGTTVVDGQYRIEFTLGGNGRTADVKLDAQILNYTLSRSARLIGDTVTHTIIVQVSGGVASEVSNTWTP